MPDFGRTGGNFSPDNEPSFDDIRRSDSFLDSLATGSPVSPEDPADAALATLLGSWRDEMRWPPATGLISEPQAVAALNAGLAEKSGGRRREKRADKQVASVTPMRNRRSLSVVGAAAAAVLCIGGFVMLYDPPTQVRDADVVLAARAELEQVQALVEQGDWQQAQEKLVAVSTQVASIGDEQQKQDLFAEFNDLSAKVVERNPEATAAPGIIYTVPPEATELVPAVAPPTSVPTAPSPSDSTSAAPTTSGEPSGTDTSSTSANPTSGAPASSQSPTSSAAPTTTPTSAAPVTTSAPAASSAATTSAAPSSAASSSPSAAQATSSAPATTTSTTPKAATSSPASSSPASAPASTTAATPTTTTPAVASPAQATTTQAPTQQQTTAAPTTPAETAADTAEEAEPSTTAVPLPVTTTTVPVAAG